MKRYEPMREHMIKVLKSKKNYEKKKSTFSYEEKIEILVTLQEKAYFFGKTRFKPWKLI